jgi:hypothetical protein
MRHGMLVYKLLVRMLYLAMIEMALTKFWRMPSHGMIQMDEICLDSPTLGLAKFSLREPNFLSLSASSRECMVRYT